MAERLAISDDGRVYRIFWILDGEEGAQLGDYLSRDEGGPEDEHRIATEAARLPGTEYDLSGLYWESKSKAQEALRKAKTALRLHRSKKTHPEWVKHALAAGWRPPRGWRL